MLEAVLLCSNAESADTFASSHRAGS